MKQVRIVILAKAPAPGLAKTRLIPRLGAEGAAQLARRLLYHTVQQALEADLGPVELCAAPDPEHPLWASLQLPRSLRWTAQGDGDLGDRLTLAAQRALVAHEAVLLIGTDCPALTRRQLIAAANALKRFDAAMIPAADGGYVLLGLRQFDPSPFDRIPWSTPEVAELTRQRIGTLGWRLWQGRTLHDIDVPDDLRWLPPHWYS